MKFYKYLPVASQDIEVVKTTMVLANLRSQRALDTLTTAYETSTDIHIKLAYAVFNLYSNLAQDVLESKTKIEESLSALEEILALNPEYWLADFYKVQILLLLPNNYRDDDEIISGLSSMIEVQNKSEYFPYFISPYLLMVKVYLTNHKLSESKKWVSKCFELRNSKLGNMSPYINPIFDYILNFYKLLGYTKEEILIQELYNLYN